MKKGFKDLPDRLFSVLGFIVGFSDENY